MILFVLDSPSILPTCIDYVRRQGLAPDRLKILMPACDISSLPEPYRPCLIACPKLTTEEQKCVDQAAAQIAQGWPQLIPVMRLARYRDINLAGLIQHGFDYFWMWVLRQVLVVKKVLAETPADKIVLGLGPAVEGPLHAPRESYFARIAREKAKQQNIPVDVLDYPLAKIRYPETLPSLTNPVKKFNFKIFQTVAFCLWHLSRPLHVVGMRASLRVGRPLLTRSEQFQWLYISHSPSPTNLLKLLFHEKILSIPVYPCPSSQCIADWEGRCLGFYPKVQTEKLFDFEGMTLVDIVHERIRLIFKYEFPALVSYIDQAHKILCHTRPEAFVFDEDVTYFQKALAEVCRCLSIKTLVIQHGVTGQSRGFVPLTATKIAAWGELSKRQLVQWGIPPERIAVTGFPGNDGLASPPDASRKSHIRKQLGIKPQQRILFYPANRVRWYDQGSLQIKMTKTEADATLTAVLDALAELKDCCLIIKTDPGAPTDCLDDVIRTT
ncbi:MAG: hypothetical protein NC930_09840, partial [Candidatus Omnitrophica bacterium]|nr:hypothetical protein [Candidatus Omnitrophota bacterium]